MIKILYDLLYVIPICLVSVGAGKQAFGVPGKGNAAYLAAIVVLAICVTLKHWRNRLKFLAPGVIAALCVSTVLIQKPEKREEFLLQNQWVLWVTLTAIACFFVGWLVAEVRTAKRIMAGLAFVGLLVSMAFWNALDKAGVALALLLIVMTLAEEVQRLWEKSGYVDSKGHLVSIAPFLLLMTMIVYMLPASSEPYDWSFAVKMWERATSMVKMTSKWIHGKDEDYEGVIGFADSTSFWGNLRTIDRDKMYLTGNRDLGRVVYLTGKVLDSFDGKEWTTSYETENRDRMLDTIETLCAVTTYDPEYVKNYARKVELWLQYEDFNTKYLFTPFKPLLGNEKIGEVEFVQYGGNLEGKKKLGYGTEYSVAAYKLNTGHPSFQEFLRSEITLDPETWELVRSQYEILDTTWEREGRVKNFGTSYEDFLRYEELIYEYYLPQTPISEELSGYVAQWLDGAETEYDKLIRIENVLSQMTYNEKPGNMPSDVITPERFLDYFLLESQEGYCSYFATAFVLLARNQGIPARYVQGFYVPKDNYDTVVVKSAMAHAWPEAYFPGIGWIPFEPTPGKKQTISWNFVRRSTGSGAGYVEMEHEEEEKEELPPIREKEKKGVVIQWRVILIPMGLVAAFLMAFLMIDRALIKSRYQKLDETGKFRATCKKSFRVLEMLGLTMEQGETLEEFAKRASKEIPKRSLGFLPECELHAYAGKIPTEKERKLAEKNLDQLLDLLKKAKGKWFFWYDFLIQRT